jgi:inosine-uridine nucleoside N-ribohydrolase
MKVIHDGDHGGDDFVATLVALGMPDLIDLLGVTTCYGNAPVEQAAHNACSALEMARRCDVPVSIGSAAPWKITRPAGDDAFGGNGLGGVEIPTPTKLPIPEPAHEWLVRCIRSATEPVTLCVTGPMTNVAILLTEHPECVSRIARIVAMGGCLDPLGPAARRGNITPHSEFNFFMDPDAADFVLRSEVPLALLPMDVTHQLVFTPERRQQALDRWGNGDGFKLVQMLSAVESLDRANFALPGAVIHDLNVFVWLAASELYSFTSIPVGVETDPDSERRGTLKRIVGSHPVEIATRLHDPDAAFEIVLESVSRSLGKSPDRELQSDFP